MKYADQRYSLPIGAAVKRHRAQWLAHPVPLGGRKAVIAPAGQPASS